jgi:hypothetical protein
MRAVVVYESMFGNTHTVAAAVGAGLEESCEVTVAPVAEATLELVAGADLLVVGGPTHVHGMTSGTSRSAAGDQAEKDEDLHLEPHADGPGLRDWLDVLPGADGRPAAAFDTRVTGPALLTGRASRAIARALKRHGYQLTGEPTSFLVDRHNHLEDGQEQAALEWGRTLAAQVVARTA